MPAKSAWPKASGRTATLPPPRILLTAQTGNGVAGNTVTRIPASTTSASGPWPSTTAASSWPPAAATPRSGCGTTKTGVQQSTLTGHTGTIVCLAFSPDGQTLASGGDDGRVKVWDVSGGKEPTTLAGRHGPVLALAFAPDGRTLATGSSDATIRLWNVVGGKQIATFMGDEGGAGRRVQRRRRKPHRGRPQPRGKVLGRAAAAHPERAMTQRAGVRPGRPAPGRLCAGVLPCRREMIPFSDLTGPVPWDSHCVARIRHAARRPGWPKPPAAAGCAVPFAATSSEFPRRPPASTATRRPTLPRDAASRSPSRKPAPSSQATLPEKELDHDSVYRLDPEPDGRYKINRVTIDTTRPNGLLFSLDYQTLYVAQSGREKTSKSGSCALIRSRTTLAWPWRSAARFWRASRHRWDAPGLGR